MDVSANPESLSVTELQGHFYYVFLELRLTFPMIASFVNCDNIVTEFGCFMWFFIQTTSDKVFH
jgi:hypothetical protein